MKVGRTSWLEIAVAAVVWLVVPTYFFGWIWPLVQAGALVTGGLLLIASHFVRPYP